MLPKLVVRRLVTSPCLSLGYFIQYTPWIMHMVVFSMMTSSNRNIFRVTGHLRGEFFGPRWIPLTKASDAELWCFLWSALNKRLSKQSWGWWFESRSRPLWGHRNVFDSCDICTYAPQPYVTFINDVICKCKGEFGGWYIIEAKHNKAWSSYVIHWACCICW